MSFIPTETQYPAGAPLDEVTRKKNRRTRGVLVVHKRSAVFVSA